MQKGEHTRSQIIGAANALFYRRGYQQTAISDIVKETGLSKGNITYHFRSKDDILKAVIAQRLADIEQMLLAWEAEYPAPMDRLERFIAMLTRSQDDLSRSGCPMGSLISELSKQEQDLADQARMMFDLFRDWLSHQFQSMGMKPRTAQKHAVSLLARAQGASLLAHAYHDPALLRGEIKAIMAWIDDLVRDETGPA